MGALKLLMDALDESREKSLKKLIPALSDLIETLRIYN